MRDCVKERLKKKKPFGSQKVAEHCRNSLQPKQLRVTPMRSLKYFVKTDCPYVNYQNFQTGPYRSSNLIILPIK